jgi:hypothetical protein
VLNTVLYNWKEGTNNEVKKRLRNTSASSLLNSLTPSLSDSVSLAAASVNADALFDRKIKLVTEGIDSFFGSKLREVPKDNALTIINYILSMKR